jgi:hypothetical protein
MYLAGEDPILAAMYTSSEKRAGHYAAAAVATLSAYALNRAGTSLYQSKIMKEQTHDRQMPISQVYLTAHLLNRMSIKPHNIETLVLGSYYGAEQEEKDLLRQNAQRIVKGLEPTEIDRKAIGEHHVRLFTTEYGGIAATAAMLGEAFQPVDNAINTVLSPKVMLPIYGLVYFNRYQHKLRGKIRTGPTRTMNAYERIVGLPAQFYNPNITSGTKEHDQYSASLDKLAGRQTPDQRGGVVEIHTHQKVVSADIFGPGEHSESSHAPKVDMSAVDE